MKAYFISGIAADERFFKNINLPDSFQPVYIKWISPNKNEPLKEYALRLSEQINLKEPFILVGLSLGGIMAVEIANHVTPVAIIIISSVPVSSHLPIYYKIVRFLGIHRILPAFAFKLSASVKRFVTYESFSDKKLIWRMIHASDPHFIKWAINAVLNWQNDIVPSSLTHIHGTRDEVFPLRFTQPTHILPRVGHTLVLTRSKEVNAILREILLPLSPSNKVI